MHTQVIPTVMDVTENSAAVDLQRFFQSAAWLYISTRYPKTVRGMLLRALVLSGLAPTGWGACLMALVRAQQENPLGKLLTPVEQPTLAATQPQVYALMTALHNYAEAHHIPVGLPLVAPAFLTLFDYSQVLYLAELQAIAGLYPIPEAYFTPWPATDVEFLKTLEYLDGANTSFGRRTIAVMGATANLIEQVVQQGIQRMKR